MLLSLLEYEIDSSSALSDRPFSVNTICLFLSSSILYSLFIHILITLSLSLSLSS